MFSGFELSNREIASLFWIAVFAAWVAWKVEVRQAFKQLILAFLNWKIQISLLVMAIYIAFVTFALAKIGVWTFASLKTTLIWSVSFAFVTVLDISRISEDATFFKKSIREAVGVTAVIVFVIEFYSHPLIAELILVPLITIAVMTHAFSENRPEYKPARTFLDWMLAFVGIAYFGYGIYQIVGNFKEFATYATVQEFAIPIILSVLFLPFIFILGLIITYERIFVRLRFQLAQQPSIQRYAKWQALLHFRANLELLRRWARHISIFRPNTRNEIRNSIDEIKRAKEREIHPPFVGPSDGWSPYLAKVFLQEEGLKTDDYHRSFEDEWVARSCHLDIGNDILPNHISYQVYGDDRAAKRLELHLTVNYPDDAEQSEERFFELVRLLLQRALGDRTGSRIADQISVDNSVTLESRWCQIRLTREDWSGGIRGGYSRQLLIECSAEARPE